MNTQEKTVLGSRKVPDTELPSFCAPELGWEATFLAQLRLLMVLATQHEKVGLLHYRCNRAAEERGIFTLFKAFPKDPPHGSILQVKTPGPSAVCCFSTFLHTSVTRTTQTSLYLQLSSPSSYQRSGLTQAEAGSGKEKLPGWP